MASPQGLEPRTIEPKSIVLPITPRRNMAPREGLEPSTTRLTAEGSAN